jgi:serine/threonine protein phosphatase PrpC
MYSVGLPPVHGADLGWVFGCSRRGASHLRGGKPCQDSYALWSGNARESSHLIAAVADGHGDRLHDLSEIGASFATQAAVQELLSSCPCDGEEAEEEFSRTFPLEVTRRWREFVVSDVRARPDAPANESEEDAFIRRYGTTLLAARVSLRRIFLGQIGDGDIILLSPDDRLSYPLAIEQTLIGLSTYSLASRNAVTLWRTVVLPRGEGGLLLLASDGLSDSFGGSDHPEFQRFVRSLRQRIDEYGIGRVAGSLPQWLSQFSERGSGDDITLVLADILPAPREEREEENNPISVEDAHDTHDGTEN